MKYILSSILTCFIFTIASTQGYDLDWANSIGDTNADRGNSIVLDHLGNVLVTGYFTGTMDADPGPNVSNLESNGVEDVFVVKLDQAGEFLWARSFGGTLEDIGTSLTVTPSGNVIVTGTFRGTVDFDPGSDNSMFNSDLGKDIFVLKLDPNGDLQWVKAIQGPDPDAFQFNERSKHIELDNLGDIYVSGNFGGTVDFDPGPNVMNQTSTAQFEDGFLLKLTSNGDFIWVNTWKGLSWGDLPYAIAIDDNNNVYATGSFPGIVDFDPGAGIFDLTSNGNQDVVIFKLDAAGNFIWAGSIGSTDNDLGTSITIGPASNLYITGRYRNDVDFDPGVGFHYLAGTILDDIFILKLTPNGNFIWAKVISHGNYLQASSIVTDQNDGVYITGDFRDNVDFDPGPDYYYMESSSVNEDIFILKLDSTGNFVSAASFGNGHESIPSMTIDGDDNLYLTGDYYGTLDFDPSAAQYNITPNGERDAFIIKFGQSPVGISDLGSIDNIRIWPNPNEGQINIDLGSMKHVDINVYDINGSLVYSKKEINSSFHSFNLENPPGTYVIKLISKGKTLANLTLVKM
jgi:hypothetical protein